MNCEKCGLENVENLNYCPNCGNHLTKDQEIVKEETEEEIIEEVVTEETPLLKEYLEPFPQLQETQRKNKFTLFNFMVILLILSIRLIFAFINNEFDTSYGTGFVFGNLAILFLISSLLLIFTKDLGNKKIYIITSILVTLYFSYLLGNQILVINHEKKLDELTLKVDSFLTDSLKDFYSGKPILKSDLNESELGEFYEFSSLVINYFEDSKNLTNKVAFKKETQLNYLYSENLPNNLSEQKTLLKSLNENIAKLIETSNEITKLNDGFVDEVNALIENEDTKQVRYYMVSFLDGFSTNFTPLTRIEDSGVQAFDSYCNILEFLISQNEKYYIEDEQFFFYTEENVEKFNGLIQSFITNYEKFSELSKL